mmetsp:Transcript_32747/g.90450  ORF Transcript_32747/g.90450 Transcript_32747/m.90450 type:complete len:228 (-) Transcript_32747:1501-2184(-)
MGKSTCGAWSVLYSTKKLAPAPQANAGIPGHRPPHRILHLNICTAEGPAQRGILRDLDFNGVTHASPCCEHALGAIPTFLDKLACVDSRAPHLIDSGLVPIGTSISWSPSSLSYFDLRAGEEVFIDVDPSAHQELQSMCARMEQCLHRHLSALALLHPRIKHLPQKSKIIQDLLTDVQLLLHLQITFNFGQLWQHMESQGWTYDDTFNQREEANKDPLGFIWHAVLD